ncbi:MAG: hypothetical protein K8F26_06390 [Thiobacillus sp.]|nr:hypothetical protein [Thiobacillus sp.]
MANLITKYFDYAQLAQASYAHFTGFDRDSVIAALITENAGNFSQTQAEFFTDPATGYTLLSHQPNTLSGFSASVSTTRYSGTDWPTYAS